MGKEAGKGGFERDVEVGSVGAEGLVGAEAEMAGAVGAEVVSTRHYEERFAERVTRKSKRWECFAQRAYEMGKQLGDLRDAAFRYYIENKIAMYGGEARIYGGYIYWFMGQRAVTVYKVPRRWQGRAV